MYHVCEKPHQTYTEQYAFQLFSATLPLESICIDALGPLIATSRGNRFLLVYILLLHKDGQDCSLERDVHRKSSQTLCSQVCLLIWTPSRADPKQRCLFYSKFILHVCNILNVRNIISTTYHPRTDVQVDRYNDIIASVQQHYASDHPQKRRTISVGGYGFLCVELWEEANQNNTPQLGTVCIGTIPSQGGV